MPLGVPRASDAADLAANGVKIIETLFAGAVIVVESDTDLFYTLDPNVWAVEIEHTVTTQDAKVT
jgi:hypothetical protein